MISKYSEVVLEEIDKFIVEDIDATVASDSKRFKIRENGLS